MTRNTPTKIRLPAGLKFELDEYVRAMGQTRSSFVREAIAAYASRTQDEKQLPTMKSETARVQTAIDLVDC